MKIILLLIFGFCCNSYVESQALHAAKLQYEDEESDSNYINYPNEINPDQPSGPGEFKWAHSADAVNQAVDEQNFQQNDILPAEKFWHRNRAFMFKRNKRCITVYTDSDSSESEEPKSLGGDSKNTFSDSSSSQSRYKRHATDYSDSSESEEDWKSWGRDSENTFSDSSSSQSRDKRHATDYSDSSESEDSKSWESDSTSSETDLSSSWGSSSSESDYSDNSDDSSDVVSRPTITDKPELVIHKPKRKRI